MTAATVSRWPAGHGVRVFVCVSGVCVCVCVGRGNDLTLHKLIPRAMGEQEE